ncbi:MAG: anti-sigma factor, partial [Planctomycetota bacterium]
MSKLHSSSVMTQAEQEWLAGHVLGNLSDEESQQADVILQQEHSSEMVERLEQTAAAVHLVLHEAAKGSDNDASSPSASEPGELPTELFDRLRREGYRQITERSSLDEATRDLNTLSESSSSSRGHQVGSTAGRFPAREMLAWFAAAAAILVSCVLWIQRPLSGKATAEKVVTERALSLAEQRTALVAQSNGLIQAEWSAGKTPVNGSENSISGDVVWDPQSQTGFMRFQGLPINDPSVEQYQLWIIDPQRDDEPIDGGVFDIAKTGEVIVAIDAKLNVISPAAFAVTIEKPGGVVVS